jgi:hypothetical protein
MANCQFPSVTCGFGKVARGEVGNWKLEVGYWIFKKEEKLSEKEEVVVSIIFNE